jgi:glycosyltransferase involved in cell wall biosynthesis
MIPSGHPSVTPKQDLVFYHAFSFRSHIHRKNPHDVVKAFRLAFPHGDEAVQLVIKAGGVDEESGEWRDFRGLAAGDPRIRILVGSLPREEMDRLMAAADVFVSLHRAEGLGLMMLEAMAMGKKVLATAYSGPDELAGYECFTPVPFSLVPVPPGQYPHADGARWAQPDVEAASRAMQGMLRRER